MACASQSALESLDRLLREWQSGPIGLRDHLRTANSWAQEGFASVPKWARITRVGRRFGPLMSIDLEVHWGREEPFEHSVFTFVPRRVKPQVGQDVAVSESTHDSHTSYIVDWDRPPQYGTPISPKAPGHTPRHD